MARDSDSEDKSPSFDPSSQEQGFVEREDDELWEVVEILDERRKQYKVRWVGVDPSTGKPWAPSWVPKSDCTDPLVKAWKRKKAEKAAKAKRKPENQSRSRVSAASTRSKPSPGTSTRSTESKPSKPKSVNAGAKRKSRANPPSPNSIVSSDVLVDVASSGRPRKKRKIAVETLPIVDPSSSFQSRSESPVPSQEALKWTEEEGEGEGEEEVKQEAEEAEEEEGMESTFEVRPPGPRKRPPRVAALPLHSDDDEDLAPRKGRPNKRVKTPPVSVRHIAKKQALKRTDPNPTTSRRTSSSASKPTTPSRTNLRSPPVSPEQESESDESTETIPHKLTKKQINGENLNPQRGSSHLKHPSPRQELHRRPSSPALTSVSTRSRSGSGKASSYLPTAVEVAARQSPTLSNHTETSQSTTADSEDKGQIVKSEGYPSLSHQDNQSDDDLYGGLEYVDVDLDPLPPPTPVQKSPVSLSSPTPPPQTSARKNKPHEPDIVPETDGEESQESQVHPPRHLTRTPSKNSVVSRMKPRTPGSKRNLLDSDLITAPLHHDDANGNAQRPQLPKQLHPLPHISPSRFTPHLQSSAIENPPSVDEIDSSIEQFDSPAKSKSKHLQSQEVFESDPSADLPLAATDVASKGMVMAEAARPWKQLGNGGPAAKYTLASLLSKKKRTDLLPAQEGHDQSTVSRPTLEEFADSFVNYDGGMGDGGGEPTRTEGTSRHVTAIEPKVYLRQEEEENTQDLLNEAANHRVMPGVNEGWAHPSIAESQHKSDEEDVQDVIDSLEVAPKSSAPMAETLHSEQATASQPYLDQPTGHMSSLLEIPPTVSPTHPVLEPSIDQTQDGSHNLESAMTLLNRKSEEISRLENLFTTAQSTVQELQVENADLKAASIAWNDERDALTSSLESARKRQTLTEGDVDFFRGQYARASAFVSEVREENRNLQERAEMAESQATTGVEGIRAMIKTRVQELESEVKYHKRVATFLIEQNERTGDDEIRRRAAEYPEMEKKCSELDEMRSGAMGMVRMFEEQLKARDQEIEVLRRERDKAQQEIGDLKRTMVVSMQEVDTLKQPNDEGIEASTGVEKMAGRTQVYRCLWRKDGKAQCDAMFLDKEGLQRHMEIGGHLQ